jgi:AcrR family transcriptional regulator
VRFLETALFLFRKQGYAATSTREIAEEVEASKANVYHHFRTKDGLLRALLDPLFEEVEALLDRHEPVPNGSPEQRTILEEYFDFDLILDKKELVSMLASDMAVLSHPEIGQRTLELNDRLLELVAGSEAGVEGQVRAACALGSLQTVAVRFFQADPEEIREAGLKAAMCAIAGEEPS